MRIILEADDQLLHSPETVYRLYERSIEHTASKETH